MDKRTVALVVTTVVAVIGTLDSALGLLERWQSGGLNIEGVVSAIRLLSGPVALLLVLLLLWRTPGRRRGIALPPERFRPEWASKDRPGHWNGIREMADQVRTDLREVSDRTGDRVTVNDLTNMQARVESLETNVAAYEDTWSLGGSFWSQQARDRWERHRGDSPDRPQHSWAVPLWERVDYVIWWIYGHPPDFRPPRGRGGFDPWAGWSDMGS